VQRLLTFLALATLFAAFLNPRPAHATRTLDGGYYIDDGKDLRFVADGNPNDVDTKEWQIRLRAYPNRPAARKVITAQARCSIPR
jgi:hypothetical protein